MLKTGVFAERDKRERVTESVAGANNEVNGMALEVHQPYDQEVAQVRNSYHKTIARMAPIRTVDMNSQLKNENMLLPMPKASLIVRRERELLLRVLHKYWIYAMPTAIFRRKLTAMAKALPILMGT
jgi:hypothetical protein